MRILGLDPGYAILGWGIIDVKGNHFTVVDYGAITTKAKTDMPLRLKIIFEELTALVEKYKPDTVAIEELFFNTNQTTGIAVAQARGVAIVACANGGMEVAEYTPLQVKQGLVGYGRAEKKQVQNMVKTILNLKEVPKPDDTADALAIAICHAHSATYRSRIPGAR